MEKIYYNQAGWVCNRYPNNFEVDDENRYIEVDEKLAGKTYSVSAGYAWKVVDGKLVTDVYDIAVIQEQENLAKIAMLKAKLADWDYKTSKYADGEYTEEEWQEIVAQRKAWRGEINRLENELFSINY